MSEDFDRLTVFNLSRYYGRRKALSKVTFSCSAGDIVGLLGPNGAGKSTLLAILGTLLAPSEGRVDYGTLSAAAGGAGLRARIGMLGHDLFLYPELTAHENLTFFGRMYGVADASTRAMRALERAGLGDGQTTQFRASHAACANASRWSGRCCTSRGSCCSTNRLPGSTRARPARWSAGWPKSSGAVC